jgi:hypothetical protein
VRGGGWVAKTSRVDRDGRASSDHRAAALELVHREVDPPREQIPQRPFHALSLHQSIEIAVLASGESEQRSVWTPWNLVHARANQSQETGLATLEARAEGRLRLLETQWVPEPGG